MLSRTTSWPGRSVAAIALAEFDDVGQVGLAGVGQRRRDADDDGVGFSQAREVRGRLEPSGQHLRGSIRRDVADVALAAPELLDLDRVDVEAEDRESACRERARQWQADVPEADDADDGLMFLDLGLQGGSGSRALATMMLRIE